MKKLLSILLMLSLMFVMSSCGNDVESDETAEITNPVTECQTTDELLDATGISLDAPKGATEVVYSYIDIGSTTAAEVIAQVAFTLDGNQYAYRAKKTDATSLYAAVERDPDADQEELSEMMEETIEECGEFAGLHYEWKSAANIDLANTREGVVAFNEGKAGFVAWLDVAPGVLYSLGMANNSTQDLLINTAEKCFIPMQGESK